MSTTEVRYAEVVAEAARIGVDVAGPAAGEVDRLARFPMEAVDALRAAGLLSALVPTQLGGLGATIGQVAEATAALGRHCASTAMIFAMHQAQVACIVRHGRSQLFEDYLRCLASDQLLLASATTEAGGNGDIGSSICAVEPKDGRLELDKQASVISYGQHCDGVLATARRTPDSPPSDQVLVLCRPPRLTLEATGTWDTLGFRGTCSLGFRLVAEVEHDTILEDPFADISRQTMVPVSHILWASVWLGLAAAAVERARRHVRSAARKRAGTTPPSALRLAELIALFRQMSDMVHGACRRYDESTGDADTLSGMGFAIAMNDLKVSASSLVVDIVGRAMTICGMAGYREDSPHSLGRILRDAHGGAVMVNNDRILANNAQMLTVHKDD